MFPAALGIALLCAPACRPAQARPLGGGIAFGRSFTDQRPGLAPPVRYTADTITPEVHYDAESAASALQFSAAHRFDFYSDSAIHRLTDGGRHAADRVTLGARRTWSPLDWATLDADYLRSHDLLDIEEGTVVPFGTVTRWHAATAAALWRLEGDLALHGTGYDAPGLADGHAAAWSARFLPVRGRTQALFVGWRSNVLSQAGQTTLRSHVASLGYRRSLGPAIRSELEVGAASSRFADGTRQQRPSVGLALSSARDVPGLFTWRLESRLEGDSLAAAAAELGYRLADGRLWLRGETRPDVEGGYYRGLRLTQRLAAGVLDSLGRANVLAFEISYEHSRPLHSEGRPAEAMRSSAWIERRVQPWMSARLGASYLRQPVGREEGVPVYRRVRMVAELIVQHR